MSCRSNLATKEPHLLEPYALPPPPPPPPHKLESGFHTTPSSIQVILIDRIEQWNSTDALATVAWSSNPNITLMLEIYRHALLHLPIGGSDEILKRPFNDSLRKLIRSYQNLFMVQRDSPPRLTYFISSHPHLQVAAPIKVIQANSIHYRRFFLENFKQIFTSPIGSAEKLGAHLKLASDMIDTLRSLVESYDVFEPEIKEALLLTILDIASTLLITPAQRPLADKLASLLCETTLWAWVRTRVQSEKLWTTLQTTFFSMFHLPEVVVQLRIKCQQLTNVVVRLLYPESKDAARKRLQQLKEELKSPGGSELPAGSSISTPPPPPPVVDPIEKLPWDVESAKFAWLKMLTVMRNVNKLTDPTVHATVFSVITDVINTLHRAELGIPTEEYNSPLRAKRINLLNVFGAWLFEACALPDMPYIKGKADACGALCRLVCMRTVNPLPVQVLRHFYAVISQALSEPTISAPLVSWAIVEHSAMIFSHALPGAGVLIPLYLAEFRRLLRPETNNPPIVRRRAIQMLGSLVCYANHLRDVDIPSVTTNTQAPEFRYQDLTRFVWQLISDIHTTEALAEHRVLCLHTMVVILQDELMNMQRSGNKTLVGDILRTLLTACTYPDEAVCTAALEGISSLASIYKQLEAADESYVGFIVEYLSTNLARQLPELFSWNINKDTHGAATRLGAPATPQQKVKAFELLATQILLQMYTILEWLLAAPSRLLDGPNNAAQRVFDALGLALLPPADAFESPETAMAGKPAASKEDDSKRRQTKEKKDKKVDEKKGDTKSKQIPQAPNAAAELRTPEEVKDDAVEGSCSDL